MSPYWYAWRQFRFSFCSQKEEEISVVQASWLGDLSENLLEKGNKLRHISPGNYEETGKFAKS